MSTAVFSQIQNATLPGSSVSGNGNSSDTRIRLSALNPQAVYQNSPIMSILATTNGMLFPYTPTISYNQSVNYMDMQMVHSNTDYQAYTRTPSVKISITGKFTVQNQREGKYALAALHFLKTASKSHFGQNDVKAGLPPPVLLLNGYGNFMFNRLRVILLSHSWTFDDSVDYIPITISGTEPLQTQDSSSSALSLLNKTNQPTGKPGSNSVNGIIKLPALFSIQCELQIIQTPNRMRTVFNFDDFASGKLMTGDGGWI